MIIDNKKTIYGIWLRKMIVTIIFTLSIIGVLFFTSIPDDAAFGRYHIVITISAVFIIYSAIGILRKPYYFYFNDKKDVLIFRYYPVALFNSRKNTMQIPKQHFSKFETNTFFFGLEENLILFQNYRNKVAKYPPISLSAVSKEDRKKLKLALEKHSQQK